MTPDKTPSEAELLPCPFCGEAAKHSFNSLYGDMSMASCKSCGATAYAPKWNRRAVLAEWGSPVVAGDPIGYLYCGGSYGDELADWEIVADQHQCDKLNEHYGALGEESKHFLYTTPQPIKEGAQHDPR